jgi:Methyltransferase domain
VASSQPALDPYLNDPTRWATSMAHHAELMLPCLDAAGARSVVEVGAFAGDLTRVLVEWAKPSAARVIAVDPAPRPQLEALDREHAELELVREASLEALPRISLPDAVIIDGDHNHFTVSEELRLVAERAAGAELPLILFHDVAWPHGRRDDYFDADLIPEGRRRPVVGDDVGIFPGDPGVRPDGLPYPKSARQEGGPGNGVLTAVEDFVAGRPELRLAVVPIFFGFAAVWPREAAYAAAVAELLDPWDRNPALERLEANRVFHIATGYARQVELWRLQARQARQEALLRRLLESSAFALADRLSRLRKRAGVAPAQTAVSKDEVRRALSDG